MPLSRDEVLKGALVLLNAEGLEALTMRRLADALDVRAGAIYWHFDDKQALYDAMGDTIMAGLLDPPLAGAWHEQLAEICKRLAAAFLRMRDSALLATRGLHPGPHALAVSEKMLAIVRDAGFDQDAALWSTSVLGYYVLGWVTDVQATEAAKSRGLRVVLDELEKTLDAKKFPRLAELGAAGLEQMASAREFQRRFEFGLEVILSGLRATLRPARAPKRKPKPKPRRRR